jgi:hypothetical protein
MVKIHDITKSKIAKIQSNSITGNVPLQKVGTVPEDPTGGSTSVTPMDLPDDNEASVSVSHSKSKSQKSSFNWYIVGAAVVVLYLLSN